MLVHQELDNANEYFYNEAESLLYYINNGTAPPGGT